MIPTEGKILFWLDGHFPGHYGYSIEYPLQFPLMEELDIIRKRFNGNNCVILCDDAWLFEDGPRHDKSPEQYRQKITVTAISELFPAHKVRVIDQQEGIVVLEP
jgi:hypothetical protein